VYSNIFEYGKVLLSAAGCHAAEGRSIKTPQPTWKTDTSADGNHRIHHLPHISVFVDGIKHL
jgi:hypothetical protein